MRKWRKMSWALIIWTILVVVWMVSAGWSANCGSEPSQSLREACEAGTGIGITIVALIGFFGFAFLAMIWYMTRPKTRPCPRCGEDVKKGVMTCKACQFDFAMMGRAEAAPST